MLRINKKLLLSLVLIFILTILNTVFAQDINDNIEENLYRDLFEYEYDRSLKGYVISKFKVKNIDFKLTIPNKINNISVKKIKDETFKDIKILENGQIKFESEELLIGKKAFENLEINKGKIIFKVDNLAFLKDSFQNVSIKDSILSFEGRNIVLFENAVDNMKVEDSELIFKMDNFIDMQKKNFNNFNFNNSKLIISSTNFRLGKESLNDNKFIDSLVDIKIKEKFIVERDSLNRAYIEGGRLELKADLFDVRNNCYNNVTIKNRKENIFIKNMEICGNSFNNKKLVNCDKNMNMINFINLGPNCFDKDLLYEGDVINIYN